MSQNEEYLKVIVMFFYIGAGLVFLIGCMPLLHIFLGFTLMGGGLAVPQGDVFAAFGGFFAAVGIFAVLFSWTVAVCMFLTGKYISERRKHTFCIVVAAVVCLYVPVGTLLGIFTIVLLVKEDIRLTFTS